MRSLVGSARLFPDVTRAETKLKLTSFPLAAPFNVFSLVWGLMVDDLQAAQFTMNGLYSHHFNSH